MPSSEGYGLEELRCLGPDISALEHERRAAVVDAHRAAKRRCDAEASTATLIISFQIATTRSSVIGQSFEREDPVAANRTGASPAIQRVPSSLHGERQLAPIAPLARARLDVRRLERALADADDRIADDPALRIELRAILDMLELASATAIYV